MHWSSDRKKFVKSEARVYRKLSYLLVMVLLFSCIFTLFLSHIDAFDLLYSYTRAHEHIELDEIVLGVFTLILFSLIATLYTSHKFLFELMDNKKELEYCAYHDNITELPNRNKLDQSLDSFLEIAKEYNDRFAVLLIDLDEFKLVNDTLGHDAGDTLLNKVAERLNS